MPPNKLLELVENAVANKVATSLKNTLGIHLERTYLNSHNCILVVKYHEKRILAGKI